MEPDQFVQYRGSYISEPSRLLPDALKLWSRTLKPGRNDGLLPTIPERFDGAIFQILRSSDDVQEICGTGFFIAPGLAISASHVFDGAESGDRFRALSLRNDGSIEWWTVEQFSRGIKRRENPLFGPDQTQHYDVALLSLRPNFEIPSVFDFTFLELEVDVPEEGDLLTVVGYRFPEIETVGDRAARGVFQMLSSVGPILDLHLAGMGWNLPAPCVIADLETPGGLSGGPVFNENGRVIGVLSKSLGDAESGRPSYVSLIWPALTAEVDATWPPNWPDGRASVRTGVMLGWVKATDLHYSTPDGRLSLVLPKPVGPAV